VTNIMSEYLRYVENTEPPVIFHRWSLLTSIGALLERNTFYGDGYFTYYPNLYVMLMGESGTRKSTSINLAKKLIQSTGYNYFSAEQTSKEKYLEDLTMQHEDLEDDLTTATIFGNSAGSEFDNRVTPSFIVAGEFNDFIGNGNIEFMSILGNLWDWSGAPYTKRLKNGKNVAIPNPTISILAGNTATGFSLAFPSSAIGQGFFSRLILVHSPATGKKIRKPNFPVVDFAAYLGEIKQYVHGRMDESPLADKLLEAIYTEFTTLDDARFNSYSTRRYAQLIKLCIICAAINARTTITEDDVILANTILVHAEQLMPQALGEFGKAKSAEVTNTILAMIRNSKSLVTLEDIWKAVSQDIDTGAQLQDIISRLIVAKKIRTTSITLPDGKKSSGFLPIRNAVVAHSEYVDFELLTQEEREMKK
jgi:hypothetical protein